MQKYFKTEVDESVFAHAKQCLDKKDTVVATVVKPINPYQEIDDRNAVLESVRQQLAVKTDSRQKLIKKPLPDTQAPK